MDQSDLMQKQFNSQIKMVHDQYNQIIGELKNDISQTKIYVTDQNRKIKDLQFENEQLSKALTSGKSNQHFKQIENQIQQLEQQHRQEKELWIKEQQDQINRLKQTYEKNKQLLIDKIEALKADKDLLQEQLDNQVKMYNKLQNTLSEQQNFHLKQVDEFRREIHQQLKCIDELKVSFDEQSESISILKGFIALIKQIIIVFYNNINRDEINYYKKINKQQQSEIQQQCKLFEELRLECKRQTPAERSKSPLQQRSLNVEKKYVQLMEQIVKTQSKIPIVQNEIANDLSRISNNQSNIRLSAINKLNDSLEEQNKSLIYNLQTKRQNSKSEYDKREEILSPQQNNKKKIQPSLLKKQTSCSSKLIKQYTFNLCELREQERKSQTRLSRKKVSKENSIVPEEHSQINNFHSNRHSMIDEKEERLITNTRFNSLLKIL
ncbi:hypothetical protein pb186bvf_004476 [Paramecium bursaria]